MKSWFHKKSQVITALVCLAWILLFSVSLALDIKSLLLLLVTIMPAMILGWYLLFDPENFLFITLFFVPLSIKLDVPGGVAIAFPSEVMAVLLMGYAVLNAGTLRIQNKRVFTQPIFLLLLLYFGWMVITSVLSEIPVVSFKHSFIQVLYIVVFYLLFLTKFTKKENIVRFFVFYSLGMLVPIINEMIRHSRYHFGPQASYYMPQPFFTEHTIYGATLAFLIPMLFYLFFFRNAYVLKGRQKTGLALILLLSVLAEFLAFSRAAWLSLLVLPICLLIIKLKLPPKLLLTGSLVLILVFLLQLDPILGIISRNEAQSNKGNIKEQIESVSNIQSDISNLERINRWKCAIRMFEARPITGFGPGTYQFIYGRYQVAGEMTRISTYRGDRGSVHSEYLGFLSESGLPGLLIFILLILAVISTSLKVIYKTHDLHVRNLAIVILLSLITFYVHSIFNGFLDTDKIGSLYYGSLAAITALDVYFFQE